MFVSSSKDTKDENDLPSYMCATIICIGLPRKMIDRLMGSEGEREMEMGQGQLRSRMGCKLDFPFIDSSISRFVSDLGNVSRIIYSQ